jgi:carbamoyltransferase
LSLILGIASSHDASACVYRDGVLVAAISEERMSRVKCDGGHLPLLAIDQCLRMAGATRGDVDHIASIYGHFPERFVTRATHAKELERRLSRALRALTGRSKDTQFSISSLLKERRDRGEAEPGDMSKSFRYREFLSETGFSADARVHFVDHHLTHAIGAAFFSGFPECAVVTMDGEGDLDMHHGSYLWRDGRLDCWHESSTIGCSPGYFYMDVTESLGFRPLRHEGKVLGLAAFGDASLLEAGFRKALRNSADGKGFDSDFAGISGAYDARAAYIEDLIRGHKREDVAAAAQSVFEDVIVVLVRNFLRESGQRRLAVNGGVFANVKLNQRIAALPECESLFVFPGMSDTGNSIGASLVVLDGLQPGFFRYKAHKLETVYWGPDPGADEIRAELERRGLAYEKVGIEGVTERAAQAIHAGKVVGWFQGAMEFGPRALGNRSMVAAPTDKSINDWFNARLERSEFMPFAPSALAEYADQVFMNVESGRHAAEFMTITFDVRPEWQSKIPAVVHVDGTARPQLVRRDRNPKYWGLIERYRQLSGIPLVLNTSFNVHEEPIVCGPSEAIQAVVDNRVDHLAIGDFWVPGEARHT